MSVSDGNNHQTTAVGPPPSALGLSWGDATRGCVASGVCAMPAMRIATVISHHGLRHFAHITPRLWDGIRGLTAETCTFSTRIVGYDAPRSGGTRPP